MLLSHVTVADPGRSDSNRLHANEVTEPSVTRQSNSIPTKFLHSAPKEVFTPKIHNSKFMNKLLEEAVQIQKCGSSLALV